MTNEHSAFRSRAQLIVLVGPKGSGKTTIGKVLGQCPGVCFLEVEHIARRVLAASANVIDEGYARRAFSAIVDELQTIERLHETIVIETTGASDHTSWFLGELDSRYRVKLVRVHARPETCAARMAARDSTRQVAVPPDLVRQMHARTMALALRWDLELVNDPPLTPEQVKQAFTTLW